MNLPHSYGGYRIIARKGRHGIYYLDIKNSSGKIVRSYKPPMQVIYLGYGERPPIAYDHDINQCHGIIDRLNKTTKADARGRRNR